MSLSAEQILELHEAHLAGETLTSIGDRVGVSREAIRQTFARHGLRTLSSSDRAARRRQETERRVAEQREHVKALYIAHGSLALVHEHLRREGIHIPRSYVAKIANEIPNREGFRRRGEYLGYPREVLIEHIRDAAQAMGEPLTKAAYQDAAKANGLAAYDTIIKCFELEDPQQPWQAALSAAGVRGNAGRGKRTATFTFEDCVHAVIDCIQETGVQRPSYVYFAQWVAHRNGHPSGPSVRKIAGWNYAVETALARLS